MLKLKKRVKSSLRVGLGFHTDGLSLAAIDCAENKFRVHACTFLKGESSADLSDQLINTVKSLGLRDVPAVAVLAPGSYSLFQVEKPEVENEELKSAIRWRIKDLLDFHIDDAVLDIFDLPQSQRKSGPSMMYVVVAKQNLIQQYVDQMEETGLEIEAIDITELTLRNVLTLAGDPEQFQALLYLPPRYGMIEIVQGDTLFLNRRIEINGSDLEEQGGFGLDESLDSLVLELQRSLDYHESQFGMGAVHSISIIAPESRRDQLRAYADENLVAKVSLLDLNGTLQDVESIDPLVLYRCLPAIGAALRSH